MAAEKMTLVDMLKADIAESVSLFFAPVTAVVREFNRAVSGDSKNASSGYAASPQPAVLHIEP